MARVLTITKDETAESIRHKLKEWNDKMVQTNKGFPAQKFTGKIKSFGDGLAFQRKIRNEWD